MNARGTCDGRHRARKNCPDPECYLREEPLEPESILEAPPGEVMAGYDVDGIPVLLPAAPPGERPPTIDEQVGGFVARAVEPQPGDPEWWAFARDNPDRAKEIVQGGALASAAEMIAHRYAEEARAIMERLASEPIGVGFGIFRWACSRDGGYQRTEYAHELPPAPAGWRWSSALVTAVGGRGKLHVSAAVVDGSEGANAATGPQSLVLEITGRGGYCTGLDVVLFARPAEVTLASR